MSLIEIDKNPSAEKLRTFGVLLPAFVAGVGAIARWRWQLPAVGMGVWIAGGALAVLFLAAPRIRRPIYVGWMVAVMPVGVCVSYLVLGITYFLILTPIGLVRRMFGDSMERRFDRKAASYWTPAEPRAEKRDYLRQF